MSGFSLAERLRSFANAAAGVRVMFTSQPNARIHAAASVVVVVAGAAFGVSLAEWCWLVLAMALVWAAEGFNTAIEALADAVHPERDPGVGRAKDVAAGAVLLAAIGAAVIGALVLGPYLVGWLGA